MNTKALRKLFKQIRDERRAASAVRVGYYCEIPPRESTQKINEEVGEIADYGTTCLDMKSDIQKLAICIGANSCEMLNMDLVLSRYIRRLQFWQRIQWVLIWMLIGAVGMMLYLSHQ